MNGPWLSSARSRPVAAAPSAASRGQAGRYSLLNYRKMTMCTPNESEVEALLGVRIGEDSRVLERSGRTVLARTGARGVLITRGSRGMALFEPDRPTVHIPISGSDQIADVTGALTGAAPRVSRDPYALPRSGHCRHR